MSALSNARDRRAPRPLSLSRLATLWDCDAEWEPDGRQCVLVWEPIDVDPLLVGPEARPHCCLGSTVIFYSAGPTRRELARRETHDLGSGLSPTLLSIDGTWYEAGGGWVVWRDTPDGRGGWFMRRQCWRNTRAARMANAAFALARGRERREVDRHATHGATR